AGLLRKLAAQARHDDIDGFAPLGKRLQSDEHRAAVALSAAGERDDALDRRIGAHDGDEIGELLAHRLKRDALIGLDVADEAAGVLLWKEALRYHDVEVNVERNRCCEHEHRQYAVVEHPRERSTVAVANRVDDALRQHGKAASPIRSR